MHMGLGCDRAIKSERSRQNKIKYDKEKRLQRAAPDLLEACKAIIEVEGMMECDNGSLCRTLAESAIDLAKEAIRKAEQ